MLKRICIFLIIISISDFNGYAQKGISVIPQPRNIEIKEGFFELNSASIVCSDDQELNRIAIFLAESVREHTDINITGIKGKGSIHLSINKSVQNPEGYILTIDTNLISIEGSNSKGVFWGVQTLRQLLPVTKSGKVKIPCLKIIDSPKYAWRSNMLDVCRHYLPVYYIKKHIDMLSFYKINTFHWHLTDDQGWRIQIRKCPKLTDNGAWRVEPDGSIYGGYYTQAEIREVVRYADERNILVIPEIEMPGHCMAALAAYPELSCRKNKLDVPSYFGVMQDVYCAGQDCTYEFIQNVLDEVISLFPSEYIHIGGDEVPKNRWKECPVCQERIKSIGLKDEHELQSYFIKKIQAYLRFKGKTVIGWDEILEGGADKDAIIEIWRGQEKAEEAIKNGNRIIQTLYISTPPASLTLEKSFNFNLRVENDNQNILGADSPVWTEYIDENNIEYMVYPRLQAFSETLWSGFTTFDDFKNRMKYHYKLMEKLSVGYGAEEKNLFNTQLKYSPTRNKWILSTQVGLPDIQLLYTENPSTSISVITSDSLTIESPSTINVLPVRHGKPVYSPVQYQILDHLALGKKVKFHQAYHKNYSLAGDYGLTDGIIGNWNYSDGTWLGWWGENLEVTIDFESVKTIKQIGLGCLQQTQSWIVLPKSVDFLISKDGNSWKLLGTLTHDIPVDEFKPLRYVFSLNLEVAVNARYLKVVAKNYGSLPAWHNGAGGYAWIFGDEVIVK